MRPMLSLHLSASSSSRADLISPSDSTPSLYGATVTSFKAAAKDGEKVEERLFVSDTAVLDGSKAVSPV